MKLINEARRMQQLAGILKEDITNDCVVMTLPLGDTTSATIKLEERDAETVAKEVFNYYKRQYLDELSIKKLDTDFYVVESESAGDETIIVGPGAPSNVKGLAYNAWGEYGDGEDIISDIPEEFWDDMFDQVDMREKSATILAQYTQSEDDTEEDEKELKTIQGTDFSMNEGN